MYPVVADWLSKAVPAFPTVEEIVPVADSVPVTARPVEERVARIDDPVPKTKLPPRLVIPKSAEEPLMVWLLEPISPIAVPFVE
jgi:hypothetical protein